MSEAVNFYKEPGEPLDRAAIDLGPFVPAPDDDVLVCRCEEVTKGDIRRAIHDGMYTMTEIRRYLRQGMGLCQGQSCTKLVRRIMAAELAGTPAVALLEPETSRAPMRPIEMSVLGNGEEGKNVAMAGTYADITDVACDVVIIGAGVIGCAAAYNLAKKGRSVTVLDREPNVGEGASSRNGGGVRQSGRDGRELPLAMYAVENIWPTLSDELGADVEYVKRGNLRLGKTEEHLQTLRKLASMSQGLGLDMKMIGPEEVREINPYLSDQVIGASWCPTDGHANPMRTTLAYYRAAKALGVRFVTGVEVKRLRKVRGRIAGVECNIGTFMANDVLLAAGLGSRGIAASVGVDIPMTGSLIECLVTEAEPTMFPQMLGVATGDFYGHQTAHGSFVFGGSSGLEESNGAFGGRPTSSITAPAECRAIMGYIPRLADAKIVRTWAGWEDESADGVPVISKIDEVPGLTIACAFTGHGFGISPIVGLLLSELVCDEPTTLDISAFRYDRFKAWL